jgi:hypothetical protein
MYLRYPRPPSWGAILQSLFQRTMPLAFLLAKLSCACARKKPGVHAAGRRKDKTAAPRCRSPGVTKYPRRKFHIQAIATNSRLRDNVGMTIIRISCEDSGGLAAGFRARRRVGRGPHQRSVAGPCRSFLSVEATILSPGNLLCGCLPIGRVTYLGEVCFPESARGILISFFPRVLLSSIHDSFAESILFASCTKHAHSTKAAQRLSSAEPPRWPAPAAFFHPTRAPHSTHGRSTRCAESPAHTRASP